MYHHQKMSAFDLNAVDQLKDKLNDYLSNIKKYLDKDEHTCEVTRIAKLFDIVISQKSNRLEKFAVFRCLEEILLDYLGFGSVNPGPRSIYKRNNLVEINKPTENHNEHHTDNKGELEQEQSEDKLSGEDTVRGPKGGEREGAEVAGASGSTGPSA